MQGRGGSGARETGVAARGGVEMRRVGGRVAAAENGEHQVTDPARFEGAGWLEVFELEEDSTVGFGGFLG